MDEDARTVGRRTVSVVIPTKNEARNIGWVLQRLPVDVDEVVVVDASVDDSTIAAALAVRPNARIVRQTRRGKGNALAAGFEAASGDYVVMIDADAATLCRAVTAAAQGDALFTDEVLHGLYDRPATDADEQPILTPREREVRALVAQGLPDKRIAELLHISVKTVEKHVGAALRKSGARNRTELAAMTGRETA